MEDRNKMGKQRAYNQLIRNLDKKYSIMIDYNVLYLITNDFKKEILIDC